jgi:radical SAM superfamily enzyme YgiQ (UPF0313 family)
MFNLESYNPNIAKLTVGLDGYSERLRFFMNRKITNDLIENFIIGLSQKTKIKGKSLFLKLYNIGGQEIETEDDFLEFKDLISKIEPKLKKRILLTTHTTPLRASPLMPIAYSKVNLDYKSIGKKGKSVLPETKKLLWFNSMFEESNYSNLEWTLIDRFTENNRKLLDNIVFNSKLRALKNNQKLNVIRNKFDISNLIRRYEINEKLPTWFLESYTPNEIIKKIRQKQMDKYINGKM